MANKELKVGDVVKLKSGSHLMTIKGIDKTQQGREYPVWCEWFDEDSKEFKVREFVVEALTLVDNK
ncbi:DUF2158 domain-containing protein [uncultured Dysgonomonas sp.]|uniref:DUF2158 domain-containing protein n=1 Tax=uncultured Dysgonomonas sp. TaxID=206096 RepID=A0A212JG31_9BACT|nr:DUF2158 domain-containing protein [uncultured Dysgonomonas sp.]SBV98361.1 conserved hypothetical protein [uncultured Dysgonomonas sp.]